MLVKKKSFSEVPSPLFSFLNGEEDVDDDDVEDQPFSSFWEWILFGTEEKEKDDKDQEKDGDSVRGAEVENQHVILSSEYKDESESAANNDVRRVLNEKHLKRLEELTALLLKLDGEPPTHTVGSD